MGAPFEFATAQRVLFGAGRLSEVPGAVAGFGVRRALLVSGRRPERAERLREALSASGVEGVTFAVSSEPTIELAREGVRAVRESGCDGVVAIGGGSALDAGKAIAALAANSGEPLDYLEVIGQGRALERVPLPFVAIPTTAGTGSEVTRNAVLGSSEARTRASLRSAWMLPRLAVVDPDLLQGAPPEVLRASGLDALSQLIEPFLSCRANPMTEALAREGITRSARSLSRSVLQGPGAQEREDLALASLWGGMCLANAGLGAVHGFAAPAGGMFGAPHGAVCAALLPAVLSVNLRALDERAPGHPARTRFDELGALLTGRRDARAADAVRWVEALCQELSVPGLGRYGMSAADLEALVRGARAASSMKGNPIALTDAELTEIARRAL